MSDATTRQNDDADTAAVSDVVRTYYDGTMTGDGVKLASAFHPRACIVGTWEGTLDWVTVAELSEGAWRIVHKTYYAHPAA
jgi:Putative lumazine-binding